MRISIAKLVACVSVALFALRPPMLLSQQAPQSGPLVLKGSTVIDGTGAQPVADAVVVIDGDKIKSIGKATAIPSDATVVDLTGKFIIPGLIETHVHWDAWMGQLYLNHGVTSVVALGDFSKEKAAAERSVRAPRIFHTGPRPNITTALTKEQIQELVKAWLTKGPDLAWFSTFNNRVKQPYQWFAEEAHRNGFMIFGHADDAPGANASGLDVVEHVWGFFEAEMSPQQLREVQEGKHVVWAAFVKDWTRMDQMIKDAVNRGAYVNPTLVYEWGSMGPTASRREYETYVLLQNPGLTYFPKALGGSLLLHHRQIKQFSSRYESMPLVTKLSPQDLQTFKDGYKNVLEFVKRFVKAGGKIHGGTDAASVAMPGLAVHHEMELLVEAGLTPMQALQAATVWPAEMLAGKGGVLGSKKVGSLVAGNIADLVVLDANPLRDITNTKHIERVMKNGKFVSLGYDPTYMSLPSDDEQGAFMNPKVEISAISPNKVVEGNPEFEMTIEGVGFIGTSIVLANGASMPTIFEGPRRLKAKIPAALVQRATPNRFGAPGPEQNEGIYGDRTIRISVFNPPPGGGTSDSTSLVVVPKWRAGAQ